MPKRVEGRIRQEHATLVEQAIEDHISDTGRFPSTTEIIARVPGVPSRAIRDILERLVAERSIVPVYQSQKNPSVYLPLYMYEAVLRQQKRPPWATSYVFPKTQTIKQEIKSQEQELNRLSRIESLLFATGRPLEEATATAFEILELEGLVCCYDDPDSWDFSFRHHENIYIADVKGKGRWADKPDVGQLSQWLQKYVDCHIDADPDQIIGLLIVNHFKDTPPVERWPFKVENRPLSEAAERYLKVGKLRFVPCIDLFEATKKVIDGQAQASAARDQFFAYILKEVSNARRED